MGPESARDAKRDRKIDRAVPPIETGNHGSESAGLSAERLHAYITAHEAATRKGSEIPVKCSVGAKSQTGDEDKASKAATSHPTSAKEAEKEKDDPWPTNYHTYSHNPRAPTGANPFASKPIIGYTTATRAFWDPASLNHELASRAAMDNIPFHPGSKPFPIGALHFHPQVPSTANGPIKHTYIPRHDPIPLATTAAPPGAPGSWVPPEVVLNDANHQGRSRPVIVGPQTYQFVSQPQFAGVPQAYLPGQPMIAAHQGYYMLGPNGTYVIGAGVPGAPFAPSPLTSPLTPPPPPGSFAFQGGLPSNQPGDIAGIGMTSLETAWQQARFAHKNNLFAPQDFKPADDDPHRFYYVRELDGNWTQRNRFSIDNMGDCRWYLADEGYFYAVRLPN